MTTTAFFLAIIFEHTWQSLAYQRKIIVPLVGVFIAALFIFLLPRTGRRVSSPGLWTVGGVVALLCASMTYLMLSEMPYRIAASNENNAIGMLENLYKAEFQFREKTKRFGTLAELANEGLVGKPLASGQTIHGYKFTNSNITANTFCLHADRVENTSGFRDLHVTEKGEYRGITSEIKGTVPRGHGKNVFEGFD